MSGPITEGQTGRCLLNGTFIASVVDDPKTCRFYSLDPLTTEGITERRLHNGTLSLPLCLPQPSWYFKTSEENGPLSLKRSVIPSVFISLDSNLGVKTLQNNSLDLSKRHEQRDVKIETARCAFRYACLKLFHQCTPKTSYWNCAPKYNQSVNQTTPSKRNVMITTGRYALR